MGSSLAEGSSLMDDVQMTNTENEGANPNAKSPSNPNSGANAPIEKKSKI